MRAVRRKDEKKREGRGNPEADESASSMLKLENNMAYRLSLLSFIVNKATSRIYGAYGLSTHQWKVLSVLNAYEPMTALDIAQWVTLDKAAISRAIQLLLKQGMVERSLRSDDARMVDVRMTSAGRKVYADVGRKLAALQETLLEDVPADQRQAMFEVLKSVEAKIRGLPPL